MSLVMALICFGLYPQPYGLCNQVTIKGCKGGGCCLSLMLMLAARILPFDIESSIYSSRKMYCCASGARALNRAWLVQGLLKTSVFVST
jgi:hypothetical protein